MLIALRLSKAGYGTPRDILNMPTKMVVTALGYERFLQEYEAEFYAINKEK